MGRLRNPYKMYGSRPIPRSTLFSRRNAQRQQQAQQMQPHEQCSLSSQEDTGNLDNVHTNKLLPPVSPVASTSAGSSEERNQQSHASPPNEESVSHCISLDDLHVSSLSEVPSSGDSLNELGPKGRKKRRKRRKNAQFKKGALLDSSESEVFSSDDGEIISDAASTSSDASFTQHSEVNYELYDEPVTDIVESETEHEEDPSYDHHEVLDNHIGCEQPPRLCPCTDVTVDDLFVRVLTLGLRHKLTWRAQVDIIRLVNSIFKNFDIPATKYHYRRRLQISGKVSGNQNVTTHIFCNFCEAYLGPRVKGDKEKVCSNVACNSTIPVNKVSNFFLTLSIEQQLKDFLLDKKFVNALQSHQARVKPADGVLSDICDGAAYQKLLADGLLSSPFDFSYSFLTDGVAFGISGRKSIWPIYLTINELPYEDRFKFMVLAGLFVGAHPGQYFLVPFVREANKLSTEGFQWKHNQNMVTSKVFPLCCIVDSGARYKILNYQIFHAKYGCTFCYQTSYRLKKKNTCWVVQDPPAELRTDDSLFDDLQNLYLKSQRTTLEAAHRGVKGPCALMELKYFSAAQGFAYDYMHALCLGCVKDHLVWMLHPKLGKRMWIGMEERNVGMDHLIKTIDNRMLSVQSSTAGFRHLRRMSMHASWKAREYLLWIVFYAVPCLMGLMKNKYLLHLSLLSAAMNIFLQRSSTRKDRERADTYLWWYSVFYQKHFGDKRMVYNFHLLSHLKTSVENFGPMWGFSAYPYEGENYYIKHLGKSHSNVAAEIVCRFTAYQSLPKLSASSLLSPCTTAFCKSIIKHDELTKFFRSSGNCIVIGKGTHHNSVGNKCVLLSPQDQASVLYYQRIVYRSKSYTTVESCAATQRNDSGVMLISGEYGIIQNFIVFPNKVLQVDVQLIKVCHEPILSGPYVKVRHIMEVKGLLERTCINIDNIQEPLFIIRTGSCNYIARLPYGCSVE